MSVTITRNPENGGNLFFTSGQISFSELRRHFTDDQSGFGSQISASQLRRDTDVRKENPIVPDATHNEQISTGNNLSLSQFRGSVKRYLATQSGTDDNSSYPGEPGFRMGLYDSNGRGLDFAGGGVNGRDGQGGNNTGNHTKNVQKGVLITGTCGSVQAGIPAAQLQPRVTVHNFRINVSGRILGYGGTGGYNPTGYPVGNASGEDGGIGLRVGSAGWQNRVRVAGGFVAGGGGGGEQGQNGERGETGTCWQEYNTQSCGGNPNCYQGGNQVRRWSGGCCQTYSYCCGLFNCACTACSQDYQYATCRKEQTSTTPTQGIGGRGGNGQGYNKARTNGENGSVGTCPTCPGGWNLAGGKCATNGGRGGDGGDWGAPGGETPGNRKRGEAGAAAVCDTVVNERWSLYGDDGPSNVRGAIINFIR